VGFQIQALLRLKTGVKNLKNFFLNLKIEFARGKAQSNMQVNV